MITSLPRSGSWLLAAGLEQTGCAGRPEEYLRPELEVRYAREWGLDAGHTVDQFWTAMLAAGTSNGVFGLKTHWQDCARMLRRARAAGRTGSDRAVLESIIPNPTYIHIVRRDTLRQAVSWCRALDSGRWWATDATAPIEDHPWDPDFDEIALLEDLLVDHERSWQRFFTVNAITPHQVVYEELVDNYATVIRAALDHLGVDPAGSAPIPDPPLRRQADQLSERWVAKYLHLQRSLAPERAARSAPAVAAASATTLAVVPADASAGPYVSLRSVLAPHPWAYAARPFPHIVARQVFRDAVYADIDRAFSDVLAAGLDAGPLGFARTTPGYDVFSHTMRQGQAGPFGLFCSRPWHDLLAAVTGIAATGHTFCGLHHHAVGSASGAVHNDLNPGWFPRAAAPSEVVLNDHALCSYYGGHVAPGVQPVETVRGVAMIFFLHNPPCSPGDGGEIGLYEHARAPVGHPAVAVPPLNNSLVLFECTPHSYHAFMGNRRTPRNSLIMWIHRPLDDVVARWGQESIINWPQR